MESQLFNFIVVFLVCLLRTKAFQQSFLYIQINVMVTKLICNKIQCFTRKSPELLDQFYVTITVQGSKQSMKQGNFKQMLYVFSAAVKKNQKKKKHLSCNLK